MPVGVSAYKLGGILEVQMPPQTLPQTLPRAGFSRGLGVHLPIPLVKRVLSTTNFANTLLGDGYRPDLPR